MSEEKRSSVGGSANKTGDGWIERVAALEKAVDALCLAIIDLRARMEAIDKVLSKKTGKSPT